MKDIELHHFELFGRKVDALHRLIQGALLLILPVERYESRRHIFQTGTADGVTGNLTLDLGTPNLGSCWYVERINVHAAAGTPSWKVFVGPQSDVREHNRQDFSAAVQDNVSDEVNPIWVDQGSYLTVQASGATASTGISVSCQVRVMKVGTPALASAAT